MYVCTGNVSEDEATWLTVCSRFAVSFKDAKPPHPSPCSHLPAALRNIRMASKCVAVTYNRKHALSMRRNSVGDAAGSSGVGCLQPQQQKHSNRKTRT